MGATVLRDFVNTGFYRILFCENVPTQNGFNPPSNRKELQAMGRLIHSFKAYI